MPTSKMRQIANKCAPKFEECGEGKLAIFLSEPQTELVTGEPTEQEILRQLRKKGYTAYDLTYFYLVRQFPQWKRQNKLQLDKFKEQSEKLLSGIMKHDFQIPIPNNLYAEFLAWYKEKVKKDFSPDDINTDMTAPYADGGYLQKLSHHTGLARDANIVQVIANQMEKHDRVMIIYGSSHFLVQQRVLEKMLGKPHLSPH